MPSDLECRSRGSRLFHCTVLLVVDDGGGDGNAGDGVGAFLSGFNVQREAARGRTGLKSVIGTFEQHLGEWHVTKRHGCRL